MKLCFPKERLLKRKISTAHYFALLFRSNLDHVSLREVREVTQKVCSGITLPAFKF